MPELRAAVRGQVITPEDAGFDQARAGFYGIDRRPVAIVRVADETDVAHVVSLARETGVELAVRSGGHSLAGHSVSEGGIVLDLTDMKALDIDTDSRSAWAQSGLTAGEFTTAVGAHGLATGFGDAATVGIGGITLGGGVGLLSRKHGLTIDSLLACEIVTADGELVHANENSHPDLFWAIQGGGGNFGVVTRLQFRLHEVDDIVGGMMMLPATPEVLRSFVELAQAAPDDLSTILNAMKAPPMPFIPEHYHGQAVLFALMAYAGNIGEGEEVVARFRALAEPIIDMVQPMKYRDIYGPGEEPPHPAAVAVRNMYVGKVDHGSAEAIVEQLRASTAPMAAVQIRVLGGAVSRVPIESTAYAHRERQIMVNVAAMYEDLGEAEIHDAWVDRLAETLDQGEPGAYVNFIGDEGAERVRAAYPGPTWDRLREIKRRYDPTNLFRLNQNIPPEG
ncbi:MAG TPA: FAD-binding oxidoreductase [Acidimicrobiia bacterium]|nr:FAD-binding oxidoreductase [Acidimicrobiia bacterium]